MRRLLAIQTTHFRCVPVEIYFFRKCVLFFFSALLCYSDVSAGSLFDKVIRGQVKSSDGSPLGSVTVTVKGTSHSVTTDSLGNFTIGVPDDQRKAVLDATNNFPILRYSDVELAFECQRWHDLLAPLPIDEGHTNTLLNQNPGYTPFR